MHPKYEGELPDGWQGGAPVTKFWNGNYIHLYRVTRACATCGAEISLDVTKGAIDGTKKNAGLLLRNCPKCRAERKTGGPGSRGGTSRPVATAPAVQSAVDNTELETLRTANATMKEELTGLYAHNSALHAEVEVLKSRLSTYELPGMEVPKVTAWTPEPHDSNGAASAELLQKWLAKNKSKMPWEGA